jgi:hypothetical protein
VWRPLILRSRLGLGGLRSLKPFNQRVDSPTQCFYLAMLTKHDIAQLCVGALEERDFCLDLLEGGCLHTHPLNPFATR